MLKDRILSTLRFFDLQDYPLTLLELQKFLIVALDELKIRLDSQHELADAGLPPAGNIITADEIINCLNTECQNEITNTLGFYHFLGREEIVHSRLGNYYYGIGREKLIRRYIGALKHLPFVRGVALAGSQAMGQQKEVSDIDLFIVTDPQFLWLARTLVTAYFQVLGKRRYGQNIANRFCLNHYLAGPKIITSLRNLYTASEYLKLRPLVYAHGIWQFTRANLFWLKVFFPNFSEIQPDNVKQSKIQEFLERLFSGKFGIFLEKMLKNWQLPKIRQEKFILVEEDELSFHPDSKQQGLLAEFFKFQKQQ